ncbi:MAG: ATP-binding cassette domain-containing protein [Actinomycetia bacterium]|nr:ATP-binding cassette domain-containing protein [Actinomycetes bacterium]
MIPVQGPIEVRPGEKIAIMGGNGVGKTSLLRAIAGLSRFVGGDSYRQSGLRVAYVPGGVVPPRISHRRLARGFRPRSVEIASALEELGYEHAPETTRIGDLSYGNLRKLLLAEALTSQCSIVCLDEAAQGLDAIGLVGLDALVRTSLGRGCAVVVAGPSVKDTGVADRTLHLGVGGASSRGMVSLTFVGPGDSASELRKSAGSLGFRER